ncbi:UNVERIFIED_CONTAM: hypothetical protein FKN15_041682 [Acipenser sinensis]
MGKWTADMQPEAYFEEGYAPVRAVIRLPCVPSSWLLQPLSSTVYYRRATEPDKYAGFYQR